MVEGVTAFAEGAEGAGSADAQANGRVSYKIRCANTRCSLDLRKLR